LHAQAGGPFAGTLIRSYPLSDTLLAVTHVWQEPGQTGYTIAAKGAPETIADLCGTRDPLDTVRTMAESGLRVLGVAEAHWPVDVPLPSDQRAFAFRFVGLIGLADPIRASVPEAVAESYRAGIRVVMLTGDYPATAQH